MVIIRITTTKVLPTLHAIVEMIMPIVQPKGVLARDTTWLAQTSVCVELTVKMTQIVTPNMTLRTVMKIYRNIPSK